MANNITVFIDILRTLVKIRNIIIIIHDLIKIFYLEII